MAGSDGFGGLPIDATKVHEVASGGTLDSGLTLGRRYVDERGRVYVFWQIDPALINNTFAAGEVAVLKASHVVTNDVSDGLDATSPIFAGIAMGSLAESTSGGTTRYGLFLTKGRVTVTITDGNAAAGDLLQTNASVDGGCIEFDETATNLAGNVTTSSFVGVALADDSGTSCDTFVASVLFG